MHKGQIVPGSLLKPGEYPSELLELVEKALRQMAFLVKLLVILPWLNPIGFGWDYRLSLHRGDGLYDRIRIIALVSNHPLGFPAFE